MSTRTERFDKVMAQIVSLGEGTPEYHDAMAFLFTIMAKRQWIIAESYRKSRRDRTKRQEAARLRKEATKHE